MIAFVEGVLDHAQPTQAVINVGGIGYELLIPISSFEKLPPPGQKCRLLTWLQVREDAHVLYGFSTEGERAMFLKLINVNGIGPKTAIGALSAIPPADLAAAIASGDIKRLSQLPGIGKKTAERMVVELRDKLDGIPTSLPSSAPAGLPSDAAGMARDALLALTALGYKQADAATAIRRAMDKAGQHATVEEIIRIALKGA